MRLRCIFVALWLLLVPAVVYLNLRHVHLATAAAEGGAAAPPPPPGPPAPPLESCGPGARCAEAGDAGCCWALGSGRMRLALRSHPALAWGAVEHGASGARLRLEAGRPLLELLAGGDSPRGSSAARCHATGAEGPPGGRRLLLRLRCGAGIEGEAEVRLPEGEEAHYARVQFRLWSADEALWPSGGLSALRLFAISGKASVEATSSPAKARFDLEDLDGLPVVVDGKFFVGVEHPMAFVGSDGAGAVVGQIPYLARLGRPTRAAPWSYGVVVGAISEPSQARREFVQYLHAERPGRRTPMVHYNSWYDFYSYQDEGFNGGFKDPFPDPALIEGLRPDRLNETNCLQRVNAFRVELAEKRNTKIDSFLWDDGWDQPESLWQFDAERFPRRFDAIASTARGFGAGTGVWLSPWGGYGFPQEARVKFGKQHGWETNWNQAMEVEAFSLAGPTYREAFKNVALSFVREQGVNMFKFDGVAGDPKELAIEMEAMLGLISDLRAATGNRSGGRRGDDAIWINLTTGTWASPFFLLWADSIWRGGSDIASRPRDWRPDGGLRSDGLSKRQRWIRWRNVIVYVLVVVRSSFFPISQLMIHGVVLASHGDALHWGLDQFDEVDFAQEVWSFVALGLQLQELYLAPRHMTPLSWDILAEGLRWARREAEVLRDSHWAFGDPTRREAYCVASWDAAAARGFVFLHNPTGVAQLTRTFDLASVLELPAAQRGAQLEVGVVKSIFRSEEGAGSDGDASVVDWGCKELPAWPPGDAPSPAGCAVLATRPVRLRLLPTEVLVLGVRGHSGPPWLVGA